MLDDDEVVNYWLTVVGEKWEGWDLPFRLIEGSRHRSWIMLVNRFVEDEVTAYFAGADAAVLAVSPLVREHSRQRRHGQWVAVGPDGSRSTRTSRSCEGAILVPARDPKAPVPTRV